MTNKNQVFSPDTQEYKNLKAFCDLLNKHSPNKHTYIIKDIYKDFGSGIVWTTILDSTNGCQVLNPFMWKDIVYERESLDNLVKEFFNDEYCQDK